LLAAVAAAGAPGAALLTHATPGRHARQHLDRRLPEDGRRGVAEVYWWLTELRALVPEPAALESLLTPGRAHRPAPPPRATR
jgi:hypothetical protein